MEFYVRKILIDLDNEENLKYGCYICRQFAFKPVNCSNCNFFACLECFNEHIRRIKDDNCLKCGNNKPI